MRSAQAGEPGSFDEIFARYRAPVWGFFRRRVPDAARAEELAQDVFAAVLAALPRYESRGSFRSYIFAIASNVLHADLRKLRTMPLQPIEDVAADAADPDAGIWVRRALALIDPGDRDILMLREFEQLSYQEIADVQNVPVNTVRSRLFRARMALKDALMEGEQVQR
jgi:RNA polymerase sigma-70 factor (ECF subfamily)